MKTFFDSKCKSCHYDGNVYPFLDQFSTAHNYAITPDNLLYEKITSGHEGISITACEKEQMKKWIDSGAN